MNFYAFSALVNGLTSVILGLLVLYKSPKRQVNIGFFLFAFFVFFWSSGYFFWQLTSNAHDALFWSRVLMAGAIFIPVAYLHLALALVKKILARKRFLAFSYVLFLVFFLLNFSSLFINRVEKVSMFDYWPVPGTAFHIFLLIWCLYVIYTSCILFHGYRHSAGVRKIQLKYIFLGFVVAFISGSINYLLWYKIPIPPVTNILVTVYVGATAYAILKYRLMDIHFIIKKSFLYVILVGIITIIFVAIMQLTMLLFGSDYLKSDFLLIIGTSLITSLIIAFGFDSIKRAILRLLDTAFPKGVIDFSAHLDHFRERTIGVVEIEALTERVLQEVKNIVPVQDVALLVKDKKENIFHEFGSSSKRRLSFKNELVDLLEREGEILIREEIKHPPYPSWIKELSLNRREIIRLLKNINAFLCVPLLEAEELIGIVILGEKENKDAYTSEEIKFLKELAPQISFALANVLAYHYALVSAMRMAKEGEV